MCRKSKSCLLLADSPTQWNRRSPLPPPIWFDGQLNLFREAVKVAADGRRDEAISILRKIRSDEMRAWFLEHGQVSGGFRVRRLGITPLKSSQVLLDPIYSPSRYEASVFERDSYTCRYCGLRQVAKPVLRAFEKAVGANEFCTGGTNAMQHGVIHAFKVVADHVEPHKYGGRTNLENLVTACPGCNYGKDRFTLAQLCLDDPRDRSPVDNGWDGLMSLLEGLKNNELRG